MTSPPRHVSLKVAMERLGVSRPTLWRMRRDRIIRATEYCRRTVIPWSEILRLTIGEARPDKPKKAQSKT